MSKKAAERFVDIVNDAHKHLDVIIGAYVANEPQKAIAHVRKLFRTIKTARKLGRPPEPYKDQVRGKILAALAREPIQPRQVRVETAILNLCKDNISERCARNWAREFMQEDIQRHEKGQKGQ
jgi:hypothetical protein